MKQSDLILRMAIRARQLADMPIDSLRASYPLLTETRAELVQHCKDAKYTRGEMIEAILIDEFDN